MECEPAQAGDVNEDDGDPTMMNAEEADRRLPKKVRRDLKKEATSLRHLLLHKPKNPYCEACTRGKMRETKSFAGSYKRNLNSGVR